jgi:dTMP kinase
MESRGKFIVIEGIDGCGKGTQTKLLSDFLSQKYEVLTKKYPEYGTPIGDLINDWLHNKHEFDVNVQAMLYFADIIKDKELVENYLKSGKMVVADRYFTTTIVYQHINGLPLEKLLKLSEMFNLRKPDICIYIKISPETSFKRKMEQKGTADLDRLEGDKKFLNSLYENYEKMAKENVFCEWTAIDGEKSVEEIFEEIKGILNKKFGI